MVVNLCVLSYSGPKFKKEDYLFEKAYVPSHDGEAIPITIVRKNQIKKNRMHKTLLIGYGAYSHPLAVEFNIVNLAALENDWIIVYAHVR